jgi:hypothetical protein
LLQYSEVKMSPGRWLGTSSRWKQHTRFQKMMGCWLRNLWVYSTCRHGNRDALRTDTQQ